VTRGNACDEVGGRAAAAAVEAIASLLFQLVEEESLLSFFCLIITAQNEKSRF
jgi:hypothetical protein